MEQNQFDKKIKESLQQLEVPFNDAPWKDIEQALDAIDLPMADGKNAFDAFISGKLENITGPAIQPNWDRMSAALDEAGMSNMAFDKEVKSKINFINPAYQPSHWELLATKLRREKAIKESLYKNKIAEATLFLLFLLNFYHYSPDFSVTAPFPVNTEVATKIVAQEQQVVAITKIEKQKQATIIKAAKSTLKPVVKKEVVKDNSTAPKIRATQTTNIADNTIYGLSNLPTIAIQGASLQPSLQPIHFGIEGDNVGLNKDLFVETLLSLMPATLPTDVVPLDCEKCKRNKPHTQFRFGMVGHVGLAIARHSSNQSLAFSTKEKMHTGTAYGSGLTFGFKRKKGELEIGAIYSQKNYKHLANNRYSQQLKGMSIQTLQFPINIRYNYAVLGKGKLHLYGQTGATWNLVLREEKDIVKLTATPTNLLEELSLTQTASVSNRATTAKTNEGILGSGEFWRDNDFSTLNLGAGAEYYISPKWSIFLQPDFQVYISKSRLSPTDDKVHSFIFSFGVKSSFD